MRNQLQIISNNSNALSNLTVDLQTGLNGTKENLTEILNDCNASFPGSGFCSNIDPNDLATQADFTDLPDVSGELKNVEDVVNRDFEKSAEDVSHLINYLFATTRISSNIGIT